MCDGMLYVFECSLCGMCLGQPSLCVACESSLCAECFCAACVLCV